jgi:hypothetical protein
MVCDAIWTDFDNDGAIDLIVAGEWMPITFLKNKDGKFENVTAETGIANQKGWWNSIVAGDFDNDGDIDYIAGNLGKNSFFRSSEEYPAKVYAKDFDNNGNIDPVITLFLKDEHGVMKEFPALNRDDITGQMPTMKKQFLSYKSFATADIHQLFSEDQLKGALILEANNFSSCFIQNKGNGKFDLKPLPAVAQLAPINGMVVADVNHDANLDVVICGNDFGNEVTAGRYDAMNGLVLLGDGKGNFNSQTIQQSGFFVPGDAKALVQLRGINNQYLLAASQNQGTIKLYKGRANTNLIQVNTDDTYVLLKLKNGKVRRAEFYYGSGFLSQSERFIIKDENTRQITINNTKGVTRVIQ